MNDWLDAMADVQSAVVDEFSEDVVVYPVDDRWTPVRTRGVFDDEAVVAALGEGAADVIYTSSCPLLGLRDSDHAAKRGDEVVVRGKRFRAVDVRPDGQGFSVMVLEATGA